MAVTGLSQSRADRISPPHLFSGAGEPGALAMDGGRRADSSELRLPLRRHLGRTCFATAAVQRNLAATQSLCRICSRGRLPRAATRAATRAGSAWCGALSSAQLRPLSESFLPSCRKRAVRREHGPLSLSQKIAAASVYRYKSTALGPHAGGQCGACCRRRAERHAAAGGQCGACCRMRAVRCVLPHVLASLNKLN